MPAQTQTYEVAKMDEAAMNDLLVTLNTFHAPAILAVLGGLLILADYYFDTTCQLTLVTVALHSRRF